MLHFCVFSFLFLFFFILSCMEEKSRVFCDSSSNLIFHVFTEKIFLFYRERQKVRLFSIATERELKHATKLWENSDCVKMRRVCTKYKSGKIICFMREWEKMLSNINICTRLRRFHARIRERRASREVKKIMMRIWGEQSRQTNTTEQGDWCLLKSLNSLLL